MRYPWICVCMFVVGSALVTGCASTGIKMEPRKLSYDVPGGPLVLTQVENPKHKVIRITPFEDKRDPKELKGDAPRNWIVPPFNWRIGTYVTSDKVWQSEGGQGGVADTITATLKDSLAKTNMYEEIKMEPNKDATGGEGLILKGEVQSFYAEQYFKMYRYFIGYWESSEQKGTPKGVCKIKYTLIDAETGQVIHEGTAAEESRDSKAQISDVGLQALRKAETKMANDLTRVLLAL